jgi:NAD(P)-dependent dehydrogenase (short-subunit alcohol dehydrogenase family)
MNLRGKRALVTGAGGGIGRAIAIVFAQHGARVGLCDIDDEGGEETAAMVTRDGGTAMYVSADVSDPMAVDCFVSHTAERFGGVDILVNNAGIGGSGARLADISDAEWHHILGVNLDGHFYCCKRALPHLIRAGGGAIVNTSSVLAVSTLPGTLTYATSKAALIGFTKELAHELGPLGIRVNCLLPGSTDTTMMWRGVLPAERAAVEEEVARAQPLKRFARPDEIARAALFLASDDASFITGAVLAVDGGLLSRIATTR